MEERDTLERIFRLMAVGYSMPEAAEMIGMNAEEVKKMIWVCIDSKRGKDLSIFPLLNAEANRKGFNSKRISKKSGVGYATLLEWFKGKTRIPLDGAIKVKRAIGSDRPLEDLFSTEPKE